MNGPEMKLRMRVTCGDAIALGPGKIALLEALDAAGSITAAARALGMSYRRAWLLVEELNTHMREPAVQTVQGGARGGGSRLTPAGREVLRLYRTIERRARRYCQADVEKLLAHFDATP